MARASVGGDHGQVLKMRVSLAIMLVLPVTLTGCPALLSDWSVAADTAAVDASADAWGPEAAAGGSGSDIGGSGGSSGSAGDLSAGGAGGSGGALGSRGGSSGSAGSGGSSSSGGASGSTGTGGAFDACALVTHDNGIGQAWQDCVPLGTYDEAQAMKACKASGAPNCRLSGCSADIHSMVCGTDASGSSYYGGCWGYASSSAGHVVDAASAGGCPISSGTWQ